MSMKNTYLLFALLILVSPVYAEAADSATGDALLYTVMISDSDQSFNNNMRSTVDHHIDRVVDYYEERAPAEADLNLETEYHSASISYSRDYKSDYSHVSKAMDSLGYSGDSWRDSINELVEHKKSEGYDQVAVIFVAPDTGRSYMRGVGNAEFTTVYYFQSESGLASLLQMEDTPSVVYAHEIGHIFGGEDEYVEEGNTGYGDISGLPSEPMNNIYPSFNYRNGPSSEESIMASYGTWDSLGWFDLNTPFSEWAKGMIGWRDFDLDGTLDANDDRMSVQFPRDRKPILNAGIDKPIFVEYTEFDEVTAGAQYDDGSLVDSFGFSLISPDSRRIDHTTVDSNKTVPSTDLEATVPDSEKPGNWTVNFLYGTQKAAWYEIEVVAPLVKLSTTEINLGRINIENQKTGEFNIQNQGKMQLLATNTDVSTEEEVLSDLRSFDVNPLSSSSESITLSPSNTGPITGQISFKTNDPRNKEVSLSLSGFAYAVRHLLISSPDSTKVDEQVELPVNIQEASSSPQEYNLQIRRNGQPVTEADYVSSRKEFGKAVLSFQKYGDYNVTVNKEDTREYVYRPDSTTLSVERLIRNLQLEMNVDRTQIDPGEKIQVSSKVNGAQTEAKLLVDGETYGQGESFDIQLDQPGTHTLRLEKTDVKTDREIRKYQSVEKTVEVSERSFLDGITHFFFNLF